MLISRPTNDGHQHRVNFLDFDNLPSGIMPAQAEPNNDLYPRKCIMRQKDSLDNLACFRNQ
jgi:hypothetical protein